MIDGLKSWEFELSTGYRVRGWMTEPTGKPVIHFTHGNGYCGLVYWQFLRQLLADYDLFISDVQGHGESDVGGHFRGWNANAQYLAQCWSNFAPLWQEVPRIAMGHSFGSVLSSLMLAQNAALFDRLVLLDPVFFPKPWAGLLVLSEPFGLLKRTPLARRARLRRAHWPDEASAYAYFYQRGMFKGWQEECLRDYIRYALRETPQGLQLKCPPEREAAIFGSFPKRLWQHLEQLRTPTDLFYGRTTYPFVIQSAKYLKQHHGFVRVHEIAGRHCFMQEAPQAVAAEVRRCLAIDWSA